MLNMDWAGRVLHCFTLRHFKEGDCWYGEVVGVSSVSPGTFGRLPNERRAQPFVICRSHSDSICAAHGMCVTTGARPT